MLALESLARELVKELQDAADSYSNIPADVRGAWEKLDICLMEIAKWRADHQLQIEEADRFLAHGNDGSSTVFIERSSIELDPDPLISPTEDGGCWVQTWLFIPKD